MNKPVTKHPPYFFIADDFESGISRFFKFRCRQTKDLPSMAIEFAFARVSICARVQDFAPDPLLNDVVENIEAIVAMNQIDRGIGVWNLSLSTKKTGGAVIAD